MRITEHADRVVLSLPTPARLGRDRSVLKTLDLEAGQLQAVLDSSGRPDEVSRLAQGLPAQSRRAVMSGPRSAIEERLAVVESQRRVLRSILSSILKVADDARHRAALLQDLLSQVPDIVGFPGAPEYGPLVDAKLEVGDCLELHVRPGSTSEAVPHRFSFRWEWGEGQPVAQGLQAQVGGVPRELADRAVAAYLESWPEALVTGNVPTSPDTLGASFTVDAVREAGRFDSTRGLRWRVAFSVAQKVVQPWRYGVRFQSSHAVLFDCETGHIEIEEVERGAAIVDGGPTPGFRDPAGR